MRVDEKTSEAILDVIVRLRDHDQYGSREKALRAFRRRCPLLSDKRSERTFDFHDALRTETIEIVKSLPLPRSKSPDFGMEEMFDASLAELKRRHPSETRSVLSAFINWVIFWHVLK